MHAHDITHRDLKPENILISRKEGEIGIKVADFGLSAYLESSELFVDRCGTPIYMAPELAFKKCYGKDVDI